MIAIDRILVYAKSLSGRAVQFDELALCSAARPNTLTFLDASEYVRVTVENENIAGVITNDAIAKELQDMTDRLRIFVCNDPRYTFFTLQNENAVGVKNRFSFASVIHPLAQIHPLAHVSAYGVQIGANVVVEPFAIILPGVAIGEGTIISAHAIVGTEGFEHKRTPTGIISVIHDGEVYIGRGVVVGAGNSIARGFSYRETRIGEETKVDSLVHIAHCAHIGRRCFLAAGAIIAGSATIDDDVWIGPNATISSQVRIGRSAKVSLGAVVIRDVASEECVSGNFAMAHARYLRGQMRSFK